MASDDCNVRLWWVSDGTVVRTLEGHNDDVWSVAFSPDGTPLASDSYDNTVRRCSVSDSSLLQTLKEHAAKIWSLVSSFLTRQRNTVFGCLGEYSRALAGI